MHIPSVPDPNVMETSTVEITPSAQAYLVELLSKQEDTDIAIRIFITDPGTPMAETCIAYSKLGEEQPTDLPASYDGFNAWIDERSVPFLEDALVDYAQDKMGGQLTIKAPNSKVPSVSDDSPLEDRINYVLHSQVNARSKTELIMSCTARLIRGSPRMVAW